LFFLEKLFSRLGWEFSPGRCRQRAWLGSADRESLFQLLPFLSVSQKRHAEGMFMKRDFARFSFGRWGLNGSLETRCSPAVAPLPHALRPHSGRRGLPARRDSIAQIALTGTRAPSNCWPHTREGCPRSFRARAVLFPKHSSRNIR
jgi:hypothetical protein